MTRNAPEPVVHVVDDDPAIRTLFQRFVPESGWKISTWESGEQFLREADLDAHGCLILDLNLPEMGGHDVFDELRSASKMPVIYISGDARVGDAVRAMKDGSRDFVEKPFRIDRMKETITQALAADLRRRITDEELEAIRTRFALLTPREQDVMKLVVTGYPNKRVATELAISPKTVEVHRAQVMSKTKAESLADLVRMAMMLGIDEAELDGGDPDADDDRA